MTRAVSIYPLSLIVFQVILLFSSFSPVFANHCIDVTVSEAKDMVDSNTSLVVLDVRNQSEYDSGHIRNAKLIPVYELEARLDELDVNDQILVYGELRERSKTACQILADHGFLHVYNMSGGITNWTDAGYPVYIKYSSIQEAINQASEGEEILVSSGVYQENIIVNRTLSLVGEDPLTTTIYGDGTQAVITVVDPYTNVTRFSIQNGTEGLYLQDGSHHSRIRNCKIANNGQGIFVNKSDYNLLSGNTIVDNTGSGIKIYASCSCATVKDNIVTTVCSVMVAALIWSTLKGVLYTTTIS